MSKVNEKPETGFSGFLQETPNFSGHLANCRAKILLFLPGSGVGSFKIKQLVNKKYMSTNNKQVIQLIQPAIQIHHHHRLNAHHFLPRLIKGMDGCFPTALGKQSTFSNILGPLV